MDTYSPRSVLEDVGMAAFAQLSGAARSMPDLPSRAEISQYHLPDEARLVSGLIERAIYTVD